MVYFIVIFKQIWMYIINLDEYNIITLLYEFVRNEEQSIKFVRHWNVYSG